MRDWRKQAEPGLRIVCYILAAVVLYELIGVAVRWNPFRGIVVPELPAFTVATNNPSEGTMGTNTVAAKVSKGTNAAARSSETNAASGSGATHPALNLTTNGMADSSNGAPALVATAGQARTNGVVPAPAHAAGTNRIAAMVSQPGGTNLSTAATTNGTNANSASAKKNRAAGDQPAIAGMNGPGSRPGFPPPGFGPAGLPAKPGGALPPGVQARISKIVDSEILGPVMHPLPMALLGIAGNFAFLRTDGGQTGLEKEGDTLGDVKLLRIGINRVLIEQNGQKKELTIFNGYGGESLLTNDSTNENKHL